VAVILFEGGMNLNLERLRREARAIRQLVTVGAAVTARLRAAALPGRRGGDGRDRPIVAVVVAGVVIGNVHARVVSELWRRPLDVRGARDGAALAAGKAHGGFTPRRSDRVGSEREPVIRC
jgi:hypothetical protein